MELSLLRVTHQIANSKNKQKLGTVSPLSTLVCQRASFGMIPKEGLGSVVKEWETPFNIWNKHKAEDIDYLRKSYPRQTLPLLSRAVCLLVLQGFRELEFKGWRIFKSRSELISTVETLLLKRDNCWLVGIEVSFLSCR